VAASLQTTEADYENGEGNAAAAIKGGSIYAGHLDNKYCISTPRKLALDPGFVSSLCLFDHQQRILFLATLTFNTRVSGISA